MTAVFKEGMNIQAEEVAKGLKELVELEKQEQQEKQNLVRTQQAIMYLRHKLGAAMDIGSGHLQLPYLLLHSEDQGHAALVLKGGFHVLCWFVTVYCSVPLWILVPRSPRHPFLMKSLRRNGWAIEFHRRGRKKRG